MFDRLSFMSDVVNNLADFVRAELAIKGLKYRDVAERSGGLISHSAVYDIINGRSLNPKTDTLKALAKGLGVAEELIFAAARGKSPNGEKIAHEQFENLSLKFSGIPSTKKERAQALLDMLDREFDRLANEK